MRIRSNARRRRHRVVAAFIGLKPAVLSVLGVGGLDSASANAPCGGHNTQISMQTGFHRNTSAGNVQGAQAGIGHDIPGLCNYTDGQTPIPGSSVWVAYSPYNSQYEIAQVGYGRRWGWATTFWFWASSNGLGDPPIALWSADPVPDPNNHGRYDGLTVYRDGNGVTQFLVGGVGRYNRSMSWLGGEVQFEGEIQRDNDFFVGKNSPAYHVNFSNVQKLYNGSWYTQSIQPSDMNQYGSGQWAIGSGQTWFGIWDQAALP